jgi:hypothetical protein
MADPLQTSIRFPGLCLSFGDDAAGSGRCHLLNRIMRG